MLEYLTLIRVSSAAQRLDKFGRVLSSAGPLRSDSDYEALLIAHEREHVTVSAAFKELAECMNVSAEGQLPFAIDAFRHFVDHDPDLGADRPAYQSFLDTYIDGRLLPSIRRKLAGCPEAEERLGQIVATLRTPTQIAADFSQLERAVSMTVFDAKATLMRQFVGRIDHLCSVIRETSPNHAVGPADDPRRRSSS